MRKTLTSLLSAVALTTACTTPTANYNDVRTGYPKNVEGVGAIGINETTEKDHPYTYFGVQTAPNKIWTADANPYNNKNEELPFTLMRERRQGVDLTGKLPTQVVPSETHDYHYIPTKMYVQEGEERKPASMVTIDVKAEITGPKERTRLDGLGLMEFNETLAKYNLAYITAPTPKGEKTRAVYLENANDGIVIPIGGTTLWIDEKSGKLKLESPNGVYDLVRVNSNDFTQRQESEKERMEAERSKAPTALEIR